jgi:hypothetical protein
LVLPLNHEIFKKLQSLYAKKILAFPGGGERICGGQYGVEMAGNLMIAEGRAGIKWISTGTCSVIYQLRLALPVN